MKSKLLFLALLATTIPLLGQGFSLDSADLLKPLSDNWTSYSGDYSGRRFSMLKDINVSNVKNLSLAWLNTNLTTGCGPTGEGGGAGEQGLAFGRGGGGAPAGPIIVGGLGDGANNQCGPARFAGGKLEVNGVIYASTIKDVYAIDAHDGQLLWHYYWKTRPGHGDS